jgi:hypothetical protein
MLCGWLSRSSISRPEPSSPLRKGLEPRPPPIKRCLTVLVGRPSREGPALLFLVVRVSTGSVRGLVRPFADRGAKLRRQLLRRRRESAQRCSQPRRTHGPSASALTASPVTRASAHVGAFWKTCSVVGQRGLLRGLPLSRAASTGWRLSGVYRRSSAPWDVLAQQPVGVFVAAPQSGAGRWGEEHAVGEVQGDLIMPGHLGALVPASMKRAAGGRLARIGSMACTRCSAWCPTGRWIRCA